MSPHRHMSPQSPSQCTLQILNLGKTELVNDQISLREKQLDMTFLSSQHLVAIRGTAFQSTLLLTSNPNPNPNPSSRKDQM